jgi:hypothetical protein
VSLSRRPTLVTGGLRRRQRSGHEVVDARALGRVVGAHPARRLVEQEEELAGMVQRSPVEPDLPGSTGTGVPFRSPRTVTRPASIRAHLAPGAVAEAGEKLVKSSHLRARLGHFRARRSTGAWGQSADSPRIDSATGPLLGCLTLATIMAVWEYKVISSGKGGFATPALLESFLNQLGTDEWEIVEFRGQPDNPLAFSGLARRPTQRDWTLGTPPPPPRASRPTSSAWSSRPSSRAPRRPPPRPAEAPVPEALREEDGLRRLRDTERDSDPDAPTDARGRLGQAGAEDELPTFFEAMRPHLRRNQRGPGFSVGVDYLAKKWDISEAEVIGALKECGLEIPDDEDAKVTSTWTTTATFTG